MSDTIDIMENLKCPVCLEFANDPMECLSCSNIFCKLCVTDPKIESCPMCREVKKFKESAFAKRLLSSVPIKCQYNCGSNIQRGEYKSHLLKCENRNFTCNLCFIESQKNEFISHILAKHEIELLNYFDKRYQEENNSQNQANFNHSKSQNNLNYDTKMYSNAFNSNNSNSNNYFKSQSGPISFIENDNYNASLGENNIFYCGGRLNFKCKCCDGTCGPTNGCVCSACMRYNCRKRNLPFGHLINKKGLVAKWHKAIFGGNFYCGGEFKHEINRLFGSKKIISGVCGSTLGSCSECETLTENKAFYFSRKELNDLNILNI
jgi:hypothetical protein